VDGNGCDYYSQITLTAPARVNISPVVTQPISCSYNTDGQITVNTTGGTGTLQYLLNNSNEQTSNVFSGLGGGTYQITVVDGNGCDYYSQITLTAPPAVVANAGTGGSYCATPGGSINLGGSPTANGGTGAYHYGWSPATGLNSSTSANPVASPLVTTLYKVVVSDANGCTASANASVTVNANPVPVITGTTSFCQGGSATLDAGGGYYSYVWGAAFNISILGTTETLVITSPGTYTVKVTDGNGCTGSTSQTMTQNHGPAPVITGPATFCQGDSITLDAGSGYNSYAWNNNIIGAGYLHGSTQEIITVSSSGTYTVTVTDGNGCTGSASQAATVNPLPVSTVSGGGTVCGGATLPNVSMALTGTAPWSLTYAINGIAQAPVNVQASPYVITKAAAGTYTVTALNDAHCTGTSFTGSATVTVNTAPAAVISSGGFTSFCTSLTLTATPVTGVTYQWVKGTASISGATTGSYTATATGSYSCKIQGACGTTTSNVMAITKIAAPPATITGPASTCLSNSGTAYTGTVTLTANAGTGYTWQWEAAGVNVSGATGLTYATGYTSATNSKATIAYNLVVTNTAAIGCSTKSATHNVIYNPLPVVTIDGVNGGTISRCNGTAAVLTATAGFIYQWYELSGTNFVPLGVTTAAYTESPVPATNVTYQVAATSTAGCTSDATITVNQGVTPSTAVTLSGPASFCNSVTLSVVNNAAFTYLWKKGSAAIGGATLSSYIPTASGSYTCTISSSTCTVTTTAVALTKLAVPTASFTGLTTLCPGQSTTLTANTATGYTWQWLLNNTAIPGATARTYATPATLPSPASYSAQVTNSSGCSAVSAAQSFSQGLPVAAITVTSGSLALCPGTSVTLDANSGTGYTWQWKKNGTSITGTAGKAESYTDSTAGSFTVVVEKNGLATCTATSAAEVVTVSTNCSGKTSGEENIDNNDSASFSYFGYLKVYPNPTEDITTLEFDSKDEGAYFIELYDVLGQRTMGQKVMAVKGVNKISLNVGKFSAGSYYINITDEQNSTRLVKLIKR